VANTRKMHRNGASLLARAFGVGFIFWLDLLMWRVVAFRSFAGFGAVPSAVALVMNGRMTSGGGRKRGCPPQAALALPSPRNAHPTAFPSTARC
jgi:hypothetical protein